MFLDGAPDCFLKKSFYLLIFQAVKCVNQASDLCPLTRVTCRNTVNQFSGLHLDSHLSMYVVKQPDKCFHIIVCCGWYLRLAVAGVARC